MIVFFHVKLSMKKTSMFLADFFLTMEKIPMKKTPKRQNLQVKIDHQPSEPVGTVGGTLLEVFSEI